MEAMSSLLPPADKKAMVANPALGEHLVETDNEGLKDNAFGWVDDSMAFINGWGFELSEIKVPVALYQGSEDKMVPYGHGQWLAKNLPKEGLKVELLEGEGHISIFVGREVEMISGLLETAGVKTN
jgi:pimeloyl-ACP methyl ester carboxylesterase